MKHALIAACLGAPIVVRVNADTTDGTRPSTGTAQLPKGQMPDRGRPASVDGGPFRNYGNPWWRKDAAASK